MPTSGGIAVSTIRCVP
ncbi:hypothetical protein TSAR_011575 [Trichomalopsis sarcophagae]|uniref:Uncharacterized protein n=1 Tax=Trichomalopsis sarcophagae TaxID=543379 RepID=A0A232EM69_9HYME|nr:hypothetical protein TSAR_011575 [Trichomalopsis sarcophagae]